MRSRLLLAPGLGSLLLVVPTLLWAAPAADAELGPAAQSIESGDLGAAITRLEALADSGVSHPDVSFTRGVAYLRRALSADPKPGDFGQATAAFRETLLFRPDDEAARDALERTELEVARSSSSQDEHVIETIGLKERALEWLDPLLLFVLTCVASLVTTLGLLLRAFATGTARTAGHLATLIGALAIALFAPLAWLSDQSGRGRDWAVVVQPRAPLLDSSGRPQKGLAPLREGALVQVLEARGPLLRLSLGNEQSFLRGNQVRRLRGPRP